MKIREGFVSNSSSSSFCIYGAYITISKAGEIAKKIGIEDEDMDLYEIVEEYLSKNKIHCEVHFAPYDSSVYVGRSWDSIGDDQTGSQFKQDVEESLKDIATEFRTFEESWYDG